MSERIRHRFIDPFVLPLVLLGIIIAVIITIGKSLLGLFVPGDTPDRLNRPDLYLALGLALLIIFGFAFLATRPANAMPFLSKKVVIGGDRAIFDPLPAPVGDQVRKGPRGTVADIAPGYTLYAQNGPLAKVLGVLPGGNDYGKRFAGFFYASGLFGASKELWVPFEAVLDVYPETRIAILAIKGDETEHFGWNIPPESLRRGEPRINDEVPNYTHSN
jgi:hypothetical protein